MQSLLRNYHSTTCSHSHDNYHQIIVPINGTLELEVGHASGYVARNKIAIVPCGEHHAFSAKGDNAFFVLDVAQDFGGDMCADLWALGVDSPIFNQSLSVQSLCEFATYRSQFLQDSQDSWLRNWKALLISTLALDISQQTHRLPDRLKRVLNHIHQYFALPLNNTKLAEIACLSQAHFIQLFKLNVGTSPQQYVTSCRIKAAKKLLLQGRKLSFIATEVGYSDQSALTKVFTKHVGQPPMHWKNTVLDKKQREMNKSIVSTKA